MIEATSVYGAGIYLAYGGSPIYKTQDVEYYAKEENCSYKWVQSSKGREVENAIQFNSQAFTFYVGRIIAFNSIQVGKVTSPTHNVMYYAWGASNHATSMYEVLVCDKSEFLQKKEHIAKATKEITDLKRELTDKNQLIAKLESKVNDLNAIPLTTAQPPSFRQ